MLNTRSARGKAIYISEVFDLSGSLIGFGCPYDKSKTDKIFRFRIRFWKNVMIRSGMVLLRLIFVMLQVAGLMHIMSLT